MNVNVNTDRADRRGVRSMALNIFSKKNQNNDENSEEIKSFTTYRDEAYRSEPEVDASYKPSYDDVENGISDMYEEEDTTDPDEPKTVGVIVLRGKIDKTNYADILSEALILLKNDRIAALKFDLQDVNYVSSYGIQMFMTVNNKAAELEKGYKLVKLRKDISSLFQMLGYASAFRVEVAEE